MVSITLHDAKLQGYTIIPPEEELLRRQASHQFVVLSQPLPNRNLIGQIRFAVLNGGRNNPAMPVVKNIFVDDQLKDRVVKGWQFYSNDAEQNLKDFLQAAGLESAAFNVTVPAYWITKDAEATLAANGNLQPFNPVANAVANISGNDGLNFYADPSLNQFRLPSVAIGSNGDGSWSLIKTGPGSAGFGSGAGALVPARRASGSTTNNVTTETSGGAGLPGGLAVKAPATTNTTAGNYKTDAELIDALQKAWGVTLEMRPTAIRFDYIYDPKATSASDVASIVEKLKQAIAADPSYAWKANMGPIAGRPAPIKP